MHGPDLDDDEDDAWARPDDDEDDAWPRPTTTTRTTRGPGRRRGPDLDDDEDDAWARPR